MNKAMMMGLMMAGMASEIIYGRPKLNGLPYETDKTDHCRICGNPTNSSDRFCSGDCRRAYKNPELKRQIRNKSEWVLNDSSWVLKNKEEEKND